MADQHADVGDHQSARMALQFLESQSRPFNADELLMGAENVERPCSGPSRVTCNVRFINRASCKVDVYWISRKGLSSLYQILQPNKAMLVNTYAGHLWHFCHVRGTQVEWLQADNEFIYNVQELNGGDGRPAVQDVFITLPLYSLQDWCKRFIVRQVKKDDLQHLRLPNIMKETLEVFTSHSNLISEQLKAVDSASLVKKRRDQLIHLFGHLIRGMFIRQTFTQLSPIWGNWLQNMNQVDNLNQLREMFTTLGEVSGNDDEPAGPAGLAETPGEEFAGYVNIIRALSANSAAQNRPEITLNARDNSVDDVARLDVNLERNSEDERDDSTSQMPSTSDLNGGSRLMDIQENQSADPRPNNRSSPPTSSIDADREPSTSHFRSPTESACDLIEPVPKRQKFDNNTDSDNDTD